MVKDSKDPPRPPTCPQWESFGGTNVDPLDRMKVDGGWVYRVTHWTHEGAVICSSICFVPDPTIARLQAGLISLDEVQKALK